jgi:TPR repeat protein
MKRVKANDPVALRHMGRKCDREGDYEGAFEYYSKAAKLGDVIAHFLLSCSYQQGEGVEKDMKKAVYHMEEAAIRGHPNARFNLGVYEAINGKTGRAAKHFIIATKLGYDDALEQVKVGLRRGDISKEDYEAALHGYHAALDATKSSQRDLAEEFEETEE